METEKDIEIFAEYLYHNLSSEFMVSSIISNFINILNDRQYPIIHDKVCKNEFGFNIDDDEELKRVQSALLKCGIRFFINNIEKGKGAKYGKIYSVFMDNNSRKIFLIIHTDECEPGLKHSSIGLLKSDVVKGLIDDKKLNVEQRPTEKEALIVSVDIDDIHLLSLYGRIDVKIREELNAASTPEERNAVYDKWSTMDLSEDSEILPEDKHHLNNL